MADHDRPAEIPQQPSGSPLTEADPKSLDILMLRIGEIFNKPPLEISTEGEGNDLQVTAEYYRRLRGKHLSDEITAAQKLKEPKGTKTRTTKPKSIKEAMTAVLNLGEE